MSDQRDNLNSLDDTDMFPPDLEDVHRLLLRDGARWRVRLPDPAPQPPIERQDARVDRRVETPGMGSAPDTHDAQHIQQNVRKEVFMGDTTDIHDTPRSPIAPPPASAGRLRGIAAVGVTVVVVALFAALLYSVAPGHTTADTTGKQATHTPAAAPTPRNNGAWPPVATLQQQPAVPVFAPTSVGTVYEAGQTVLRRSDDGGTTWQTLTPPADSGANAADVSILVSPLDAHKVILQVTAYQAQGVTSCPTAFSPGAGGAVASRGAIPLSSNIPLGGSITCTVQYFSADGGQRWAHLQAPSGAVLGNKDPEAIVPGTPSTPIFAQGSRLYTYAGCGALCMGPGYRILTSANGGASWSYADAALASQSANVCSFMPTSSGSSVFALTNSSGCSMVPDSSGFALWRSTDAGANWSRLMLPAGSQTPHSVFVVSHGSDQPLLYLNMEAPPQPHIGGVTSTPTDLHVSADGGQHWSAAPVSGVPTNSTTSFGPIGALSDGTIIEPFFAANGGHPTFYGWKQGDAAWHAIGKPVTENIVSLTVIPTDTGTHDQLWLVTVASTMQQGAIVYNASVLNTGN